MPPKKGKKVGGWWEGLSPEQLQKAQLKAEVDAHAALSRFSTKVCRISTRDAVRRAWWDPECEKIVDGLIRKEEAAERRKRKRAFKQRLADRYEKDHVVSSPEH